MYHSQRLYANLNNSKVIEYLIKKGYTRTEQVLRQESTNLDREGRPIFDRAEDFGNQKYSRAFELLSSWIDQNLDIYKVNSILVRDAIWAKPIAVRTESIIMADLYLFLLRTCYGFIH